MSVLSTMVFADISGSTALYEALGNERATEAVTQVTQWIGDTIEAHGGRVVKKLGDGGLGGFGDAVNVASRLCERAGPAEIWATETTVLLAGTAPDVWYRKLGMMDIRGKAELLMLYHDEWREDEAPDSLTMQAALVSNFAPVDSILGQIQFSWHGVDRTFTSSDAPVMVGRAEHAQLRINDPRVSRLHARIDWRNSGFVLTDMSSF